MNFSKALDLISNTDKKIKDMREAQTKLQHSLAALAEIENGASLVVRLACKPINEKEEEAEMSINELLNIGELTQNIRDALDHEARRNYLQLLAYEQNRESGGNDPQLEIPEAEADGLETPERTRPGEIKVRHHVNKAELADLYFKQGKTVKEIVRETGLGENTIFKHIAAIKAEKEKTAKECARR